MDEPPVSLAKAHLRVARPHGRLDRVVKFYRDGLGFEVLYEFHDLMASTASCWVTPEQVIT
jgi:hypothetical protein